jgi:hypothetical protein
MFAKSFPLRTMATLEKTFLASDLEILDHPNKKSKPGPEHQYSFGGITTDYMLECNFDRQNGGW